MGAFRADPLLSAIRSLEPVSELEARDVRRTTTLIGEGDPWNRSTTLHLTASALILHPPTCRVLLRYHERLRGWLQVGGHGEAGERDPLAIALREAAEETGLADLRPWPDDALRHLVIVPVPANRDEPAHLHADLRFFLATDDPDSAVPERPAAPLRWLTIEQTGSLVGEDNLTETIRRAASLLGPARVVSPTPGGC